MMRRKTIDCSFETSVSVELVPASLRVLDDSVDLPKAGPQAGLVHLFRYLKSESSMDAVTGQHIPVQLRDRT